MFIPKLFIFVGGFNHFFTLRVSYQYEYFIRGRRYVETRYTHIKNLSQDWNEAVAKAREAEKQLGIQLVVHENREKQLDEIKRLSHEEKEAQRRAAQEEHRIAQEEQDRRNREGWVKTVRMINDRLSGIVRNEDTEEDYVEMLRDCFESSGKEFTEELEAKARANYNPIASHKPEMGRMIYGAFDRVLLSEVPVRYMQWLVYKSGLCDVEDTYGMPMAVVAQWLRDNYNVPEIVDSKWVGEVGQKTEMQLIKQDVRTIDGAYGYVYLYNLVDTDGNTFVWFASKPALSGFKNGEKINLKFTIKAHNEFNGEKQTAITRAKVA